MVRRLFGAALSPASFFVLLAATVSLGPMLLSGCGGGGAAITIEIVPSTAQSLDENESLSFTALLANDTHNKGVTWKLTGSGCAGTPATGCGTLSNVTPLSVTYTAPAVSAATPVTLTATSNAQTSVTQTVTITVEIAPTFSTPCVGSASPCTLPNGQNGEPYNVAIGVINGVTPYTFSVTTGASAFAAACLHLNATSGQIVGTPCNTTAVDLNFTVQMADDGGAAPITQVYTIFLEPAPVLSITTHTLPLGYTNSQYSASISTQGGVTPLTFTLLSGNPLPAGLALNPHTGQVSGVPTAAGTFTFSVQVQDSSLPSPGQIVSGTVSVTIMNPQPLSITTTTLPVGSTAAPYNGTLQATGGVTPYNWTIIQGQLPPGLTLNSTTGVISGTPILVTTSTFTVQVTDAEVTPPAPVTRSLTITINAGSTNGNILFSGQYSFLFKGFDSNGTVAIVGTITADGGGNITAGTADSNRQDSTSSHNTVVVTGQAITGTYTVGNDGRGTLQLTNENPQTSALVTTDYSLVLQSDGSAEFIETHPTPAPANADTFNTHGEGVLKPVFGSNFSSANLSGNYAFEFTGQDVAGNPTALAGVATATGTNGLFTPGTSDFNDNGAYTSQPITGNFIFQSDNSGLAAFLFQVPSKTDVTISFVFYFISPNDLYFMEIDTATTSKSSIFYRLSGEMILQQTTAVFSSTSLQGASVVTGTAVNGTNSNVLVGLLTATQCNGATPATLNYDENNGGTITSPSPSFSGTCTVAANGRAAFTNFGSRVAAAYLTGPGTGFLIGSDTGVTTGLLEQQEAGPFADSSVEGTYALSAPHEAETNVPAIVAQVSADGAGDFTGTADEVDPPGTTAHLDQPFSATINSLNATTGRGTMTTNTPAGFPTNVVFYVLSPAAIRAIGADPGVANPQVIFFTH
jgi:large repetitive protein